MPRVREIDDKFAIGNHQDWHKAKSKIEYLQKLTNASHSQMMMV